MRVVPGGDERSLTVLDARTPARSRRSVKWRFPPIGEVPDRLLIDSLDVTGTPAAGANLRLNSCRSIHHSSV